MKNIKIKKAMTAALALLLAISMSLALAGCRNDAPRVYFALGDSVSAGFGREPEEAHGNLLFEKLREQGIADEYQNLAVNGYTTAALLEFLENVEGLAIFENAAVITLNIGGNNILLPFLEYFPDFDELLDSAAQLAEFLQEFETTMTETMEFLTEAQELLENFALTEVVRLFELLQGASPILEGVAGMLGEARQLEMLSTLALLRGTLPDELNAKLNAGIAAFAEDFVRIIDWLNVNAPDAAIIVNTIYNPIPQDQFGLLSGLNSQANRLITSMNRVILSQAEAGGYLVSDVYAAFESQGNMIDLLNFELDIETMTLNFDILHPNAAGHQLIAELNYEVLSR